MKLTSAALFLSVAALPVLGGCYTERETVRGEEDIRTRETTTTRQTQTERDRERESSGTMGETATREESRTEEMDRGSIGMSERDQVRLESASAVRFDGSLGFSDAGSGQVRVMVNVRDAKPGTYGVHVMGVSSCGELLDERQQHHLQMSEGKPVTQGHLGTLIVDENGKGTFTKLVPSSQLYSAAVGRAQKNALVVHEMAQSGMHHPGMSPSGESRGSGDVLGGQERGSTPPGDIRGQMGGMGSMGHPVACGEIPDRSQLFPQG